MKLANPKLSSCAVGAALLALCAAFPALADYQSTIASQTPVGYWRLGETTAPQPPALATNLGTLGAPGNGSYTAYPTKGVPGALGGVDKGVAFNGLSQWAQTPFNASLNPTNSWSVETWLRPDLAKPNGNLTCALASMHSSSPRSGWLIYQSGGLTDTTAPGWEFRMYAQNELNTSLRLLVTNNVTPGTWYHLVFTYDGATLKGYLNGVLSNSGNPPAYVPNQDAAFSVGARTDNGFPWQGAADEVALYGAVLTDTQVAAHYAAGTNNNPTAYAGLVLGLNPLLYWHLDEPADPVATNLGMIGSEGNGLYIYNAIPGHTGPSTPTFPGFEAANKACGFDGTNGSVLLPALNLNTNTVTITCWVKANGLQFKGAGIVMNRADTNASGLNIDTTGGGLMLGYDWNEDPSTYAWQSHLMIPDGQWAFAALIVRPDQAVLWELDPSMGFTLPSTNAIAHAVQAFDGPTRIGSDAQDPPRTFNGSIDEVAIFNRELMLGEVYSQYAAAKGGLAPMVFWDPQPPAKTPFEGDTLILTVDAGGTPALGYQWRKGGQPIAGATSATYTKTSLAVADAGSYDVVITNQYGTATSQPVSVAVNALLPPNITRQPQGRTVYRGGTVSLSVTATGGQLSYQWQMQSGASWNNLPGAVQTNYSIKSAVGTDAGTYRLIVSNRLMTATSALATVTVIVPAAGSYSASIVADAPEAWWRLDELAGSTNLVDAMGRHDGVYVGTATLGAPGVESGGSDTAVTFDGATQSYGKVPYSALLNSAAMTLECWAKTTVLTNTGLCPVSTRASTRGGWFWTYPLGSWSGGKNIGGKTYYIPGPSGATGSSAIIAGQWMHLVLTASSGTLRCYVNGQNGGEYVDFDRNTSGPLIIGARGVTTSSVDELFNGSVDEVAVYTKALSQAQIQAHYVAALYGNSTKPIFKQQPFSQTVVVGSTVNFNTAVEGSLPISFRWYQGGSPLASGINAILTLPNVTYSSAGAYQLVATNSAGSTSSAVVNLTVMPVPAFANATNGLILHLKFDGNFQDSSGRGNHATAVGSPSFVAGKLGSGGVRYLTQTDLGPKYDHSSTAPKPVVTNANYLRLGSPPDLHFSSNVNFSVAYWVRLPAGQTNGDLPFLCNATNSWSNPGITFAPSYRLGGWSYSLNGVVEPYGSDNSINNGNWHHLVHSFDRTGNAVTYLDGVQVDSRSMSGAGDLDTPFPFNIGQDPTGAYPEESTADLDDLGVWRRALNQFEAYAIYNAANTYGKSFDTYGPVTLVASTSGGSILLVWQAGALQWADNVNGTYTDVPSAVAPYYKVTPTAARKFYRVKL